MARVRCPGRRIQRVPIPDVTVTLPEQEDDSAVSAFTAIRNRSKKNGTGMTAERKDA
ncbi:MAG: hypothetical protein ACRDN0_03600 [Trebonia sp.]